MRLVRDFFSFHVYPLSHYKGYIFFENQIFNRKSFRESHDFIVDYCGGDEDAANQLVQSFLNRSLTSRLGIRLLVTHHLKLRQQIHQQRAQVSLLRTSLIPTGAGNRGIFGKIFNLSTT